jgi:hypothetical protein
MAPLNGSGPDREWVVFADPREAGRRWKVDVTFLASHWRCIYGAGCQGVLTAPTPERAQGCCSYGAHFCDDKDRKRIEKLATRLTDADWQFARTGRARGISAKTGSAWRTRLVDDACIFLNRPGFAAGPGCALHAWALRTGRSPHETKPEVCWQLPLRRVDTEDSDGGVTSTLSEFGRDGWGEGGAEFAWWCTEAPEAFTHTEPVYRSLETELRAMVGDNLFERIAAYLDERRASSVPPVAHPSEVPVRLVKKPR